ncbi:hypothetical protein [Bifidobacterium tsurumiense]|uniref:hypothetical protein n=1 Tax=Bifidobacterium tsurumiense TaxID=356829 RepID=UPI0012B3FB73|nr:hypothetical protein [Bifidobacterium tsurumiense]MDY4678376.1 hypothetical protein [Bifidobacterium tsurumiense]MSS11971.1 hypothetical protein [Bifidobacterium tsurumiense]
MTQSKDLILSVGYASVSDSGPNIPMTDSGPSTPTTQHHATGCRKYREGKYQSYLRTGIGQLLMTLFDNQHLVIGIIRGIAVLIRILAITTAFALATIRSLSAIGSTLLVAITGSGSRIAVSVCCSTTVI